MIRRFAVIRDVSVAGVSGVGHVADGCVFTDGTTVVRWRGDQASTVIWESADQVLAIHGPGGPTRVEWIDEEAPT